MDRVVSAADLRRCVLRDAEALACVVGCYSRHARGRADGGRQLTVSLGADGAGVATSTARVDGLYSLAVRVAGRGGAADAGGEEAVLLLSPETGAPQALLLDDGYLRALGVDLAGAAAARTLAAPEVRCVAVLGPAARALDALEALALVRDFEEVLLAGSPGEVEEAASATELPVRAVTRREEAVTAAQLVLAVGNPDSGGGGALFDPAWIRPGQHVWCLGDAAPTSPEALAPFDHVACARAEASPLRGAVPGELIELGRLTSGQHAGREDEGARTLFHATPEPMVDTALAFLAWRKSQKYGLGVALGEG